ncbi:hypothetical protein SNE40_000604 [Patella caerulea]|uniref:Farnesoic acid O-methyl transferase domain-containing protein n=1 Tax=Patella caerulea TaxID=87958 RepID=A0AAN8KGW3_PATCE
MLTEMDVSMRFQILLLFCSIHLTTTEIQSLPKVSKYGRFINVENQEYKVIFMKTCVSGIFGFFENTTLKGAVYEVKIGSTKLSTEIRNRYKGEPLNITHDPDLLPEENRFKPFYFKWTNNTMVVGAGTVVGQGTSLQWSSERNVTVRFFSVRTGSCPMDYILELSCKKV